MATPDAGVYSVARDTSTDVHGSQVNKTSFTGIYAGEMAWVVILLVYP